MELAEEEKRTGRCCADRRGGEESALSVDVGFGWTDLGCCFGDDRRAEDMILPHVAQLKLPRKSSRTCRSRSF
ncbi:hypothetical protein Drorol1_Dr00026940 [Drosera rotundifolia]